MLGGERVDESVWAHSSKPLCLTCCETVELLSVSMKSNTSLLKRRIHQRTHSYVHQSRSDPDSSSSRRSHMIIYPTEG